MFFFVFEGENRETTKSLIISSSNGTLFPGGPHLDAIFSVSSIYVALYEEWTRVRMKTTSRKVGNNIRRAIFLEGRLFVSGKREQFYPKTGKKFSGVLSCCL